MPHANRALNWWKYGKSGGIQHSAIFLTVTSEVVGFSFVKTKELYIAIVLLKDDMNNE